MRRPILVIVVLSVVMGLLGGCGTMMQLKYRDQIYAAIVSGDWATVVTLSQDWIRRDRRDSVPVCVALAAYDHEGKFDVGYRGHVALLGHAGGSIMGRVGVATFADLLVKHHPDNALAWQVASAVYLESRHAVRALGSAQRAIELAPKDPASWLARGDAHRLWSQPDLAVADYTKALHLDPKSVTAYCDRDLAYEDEGQKAKAKTDFGAAEKLAPDEAQKVVEAKREDMAALRVLLHKEQEEP